MNRDEDDKPSARLFERPIQEGATRKVSVHPDLLKDSQRPDGAKATKVEEESPAENDEPQPENPDLFDRLFGDVDIDSEE